jgi:hypothetical protein
LLRKFHFSNPLLPQLLPCYIVYSLYRKPMNTEVGSAYTMLVGKPEEKRMGSMGSMGNLEVDGRTILKRIFKK